MADNSEESSRRAWLVEHHAPLLLSSLVLTGEGETELEAYAGRRSNPAITCEQVRAAKQLAMAICYAVIGGSSQDWDRIARAAEATRRVRQPDSKTTSSTHAKSSASPEPPHAAKPPAAYPPSAPPRDVSAAQPVPMPAAPEPPAVPLAAPLNPHAPVETEAIDLAAVAKLMADNPSATPFATSPSGSHSAASMPPPPSLSYAPHPQAGATEGIDEAAIQAAIAGSYPLPAASLDRLPLPLDRYGALVARSEAARDVAQLSALYAEYGVQGTAHRTRIDEEYRAVFEQHPELRYAFDDVVAQWRAYLRRG